MYDSMSKKLMKFEYDRAGGDMDKFIQSWRGVSEEDDPEYYEKVMGKLPDWRDDFVNPAHQSAFNY
jgi:hypothetical protein